jgi:hypothetical protein
VFAVSTPSVVANLKGNTLRVYWFLLQCPNNCGGPRQIQRELGFKSPALASYHLDKLLELGLVDKKGGEYQVTSVVEVGVLKQFMKVGTFMIPRYITYATMMTILLLFFLTQLRQLNFYSLFALIFATLSTTIFWYETLKIWKSKP